MIDKERLIEFFKTNISWILLVSVLSILVIIAIIKIYKKYTKQILSNTDFNGKFINRILHGKVVNIYDGDGFRFIHTPFMHKETPFKRGDKSLSIRLAGVDAPESKSFNNPGQKFAKDAKDFLISLILNKRVRITVLAMDIYNRLVCKVEVKNHQNKYVNVSVEMVKNGWACVFSGKNAVYGNFKKELEDLEIIAKNKKLGMWLDPNTITPMEYKRKCREASGKISVTP